MKSQAALEYMVVISLALLFIIPFFLLAQTSVRDLDTSINLIETKETIDKLSDSIKLVYAQGEDAKMSLYVKFPKNIVSTHVVQQMIIININVNSLNNSIFEIFDFDVTGTLPDTYGSHKIVLTNINNTVNISRIN
ncbi:MAG: hypothetical protein KAQ92_04905 [Candidatus Aenigmarchaeota archaeon]|nr:hypothetical protein [Candidatus Aenigmarchaeota archaeon]